MRAPTYNATVAGFLAPVKRCSFSHRSLLKINVVVVVFYVFGFFKFDSVSYAVL